MSKTVSVYFDDTEEKTYTDAMDQRVKPKWGGKISPYVVDLVKKDLAGDGPIVQPSDTVVVQLAKLYHPTLTAELTQALATEKAPKQSRIIARFLEALLEAMKRSDFRADGRFHLFNSMDQLNAQVTGTAPGIALMRSLQQFLEDSPEAQAMAAEDMATYGGVSAAAAEAERRKSAARKSDRKPTKPHRSGSAGLESGA